MSTNAQQAPGITRIDLQQHDLSVSGREVIQNRVEISPEALPYKHFHYGEEHRRRGRDGARHVRCREGEAAHHARRVSNEVDRAGTSRRGRIDGY
jgi:hypothetical protein